MRATPSPSAAIRSVNLCVGGWTSNPGRTACPPLLPNVEIVPGLIKENRRFVQKPCELTASMTLSWVKCYICILMGCYRVINAPVRMHYPGSELKGSLPNHLSLHFEIGISLGNLLFFIFFMSYDMMLFCITFPLAAIVEEIQKDGA